MLSCTHNLHNILTWCPCIRWIIRRRLPWVSITEACGHSCCKVWGHFSPIYWDLWLLKVQTLWAGDYFFFYFFFHSQPAWFEEDNLFSSPVQSPKLSNMLEIMVVISVQHSPLCNSLLWSKIQFHNMFWENIFEHTNCYFMHSRGFHPYL